MVESSAVERVLHSVRSRLDRVAVEDLADEVAAGALVVDIRPEVNRDAEGELRGAVVIERIHLEWRLDPTSPDRIAEAVPGRRVVVVCNEGYASSLAASLAPPGRRRPGHRSDRRLPGLAPAHRSPRSVNRGGTDMAVTDELLGHNDAYASDFDKGDLPMPPGKRVAVLACMDARLDPAKVLGLDEGDAHVIRNAGGVVSEDAVRSLVISQRLLGTEEIVLIHHTDCGMLTFDDNSVKDQIEADTGLRPNFALEAFPDADADVRQSIARIQANPFIPKKDQVRGFVYEVETGKLREVG